MATPQENLAKSLEALKELQDTGIMAIKTSELSRVDRERLIKNGFLREILKGWYLSVPNHEKDGDSTSWYTSFWHFCARYLDDRYGEDYCISAEQSLQIHAGNLTVPKQLIIRSVSGPNALTPLPFDTSLFTMISPLPEAADIEVEDGIRMLTLPSSLIHCSSTLFVKNSIDARAALLMIPDASDILDLLLKGGHSTIAGRLAGAFRNVGSERIANDIIKNMQSAGYVIRETDPFESQTPVPLSGREKSPYANRTRLMWHEMRKVIMNNVPPAPGLPKDIENYMKDVEEKYVTDAYHSLSIERYRVTPELIERVRSGAWDAGKNEDDKKQRDAMAARGYWQATQKVRESILKILKNQNAGKVVDEDHGEWYTELFAPSVAAGILERRDLAGYRTNQVYIGGSKHVPLNKDAVRDTMPVLFELLEQESEPFVRAVLGHFIFVFIHPYMDGNGRMGRFLMNAMLASGGYPWTVIPVEERATYMKALEKASVEENIEDFAKFIAYLVDSTLKGKPVATIIPRVEFPPYRFFKNSKEAKYETWPVDVSEKFRTLRLSNITLTPIEAKQALAIEITINAGAERQVYKYNLADLFYNQNLSDTLFFVDDKKKPIDIFLPEGRKRITYRINLLSDIKEFDALLACEYL
jgi:hypothetical protein